MKTELTDVTIVGLKVGRAPLNDLYVDEFTGFTCFPNFEPSNKLKKFDSEIMKKFKKCYLTLEINALEALQVIYFYDEESNYLGRHQINIFKFFDYYFTGEK